VAQTDNQSFEYTFTAVLADDSLTYQIAYDIIWCEFVTTHTDVESLADLESYYIYSLLLDPGLPTFTINLLTFKSDHAWCNSQITMSLVTYDASVITSTVFSTDGVSDHELSVDIEQLRVSSP
jgi:hypothetical protein